MKLFAVTALALSFAFALGQGTPAQQEKLQAALTKFDQKLPDLDEDIREDAEFIRGLFKSYYTQRDELTMSEVEVVEGVLYEIGMSKIAGRRYKELKHRPVPGNAEAPAPSSNPPRRAVSGVDSHPVFTSGVRSLAGGKQVGFVQLVVGREKKRVVELPGTEKISAADRAARIAKRFQTVAAADPLWWMKLKVDTANGEAVVKVVGAKLPFVLTADKAFAREWGETPSSLANRVRRQIRNTFDRSSGDGIGSRDDDMRDHALEHRQAGDDLMEKSPDSALAEYKKAIEADPTYGTPYVRIADIHKQAKETALARAILEKGLAVAGMSEEDKAELKAALAELGG